MHFSPKLPWHIQPHQKLIQIDVDPEEVGRNLPVAVGITADGRLALQALLHELGGSTHSSQWTEGEISTIRRELDDDAILVSGTTQIGYWSHLVFPVLSPRSYITPGYFATLGYAFPTALGAKVGNPHRQVVATIGDGGFGYAPGELATAVQEDINAVTIVFNNGSLGASYSDQQVRFGGRVIGTRLHNPDFAQLAEVYGALGIELAGHQELGDALRSALQAQRPVVIEVPLPDLAPPFQIPPPGAAH